MPSVSMTELEIAFQFLQDMSNDAVYVSTRTGRIYVIHDDMKADEDVPEDIDISEEFARLPDKREFDLGNELAYRFTEIEIPHEYENVRNIFHHKGAYGRFKHLLESNKLLQRWHQFEQEQTEAALREWCEQNGLEVTK